MILGIMQPYFLPYLEHFRLLAACDRWIVFDTVAYRRKTWMSRNRILNRDTGWSYISVPIAKGATQGRVAEAALPAGDWTNTLRDHLKIYAYEAPFYEETCTLLEEVLTEQHTSLAAFNTATLGLICEHLDITTPIERLSEMDIDLPSRADAGDWALLISKAVGATEYRNPSGGGELFDPGRFEAAGVALSFHRHRETAYATGTFEFVSDLSILDQLMWCGRGEVRSWITQGA